jgi:hypothetical protein
MHAQVSSLRLSYAAAGLSPRPMSSSCVRAPRQNAAHASSSPSHSRHRGSMSDAGRRGGTATGLPRRSRCSGPTRWWPGGSTALRRLSLGDDDLPVQPDVAYKPGTLHSPAVWLLVLHLHPPRRSPCSRRYIVGMAECHGDRAHGSGGRLSGLANLCHLPARTRSLIPRRSESFRVYSGSPKLPRDRPHRAGDGPRPGPGRLPPGPWFLTGVSAESPVSSVTQISGRRGQLGVKLPGSR